MSTIEQNLLSGLDRELREESETAQLEILETLHKEIELRIEAIKYPVEKEPEMATLKRKDLRQAV